MKPLHTKTSPENLQPLPAKEAPDPSALTKRKPRARKTALEDDAFSESPGEQALVEVSPAQCLDCVTKQPGGHGASDALGAPQSAAAGGVADRPVEVPATGLDHRLGSSTAVAPDVLNGLWPGLPWAALGAVALGTAASAGFGSSGAGGSPAAGSGTTVSGLVVLGPVLAGHQLEVQLYRADGTELGDPVAVRPDGTFSVPIAGYSGVIKARLLDRGPGDDFKDEATGRDTDISADVWAVGFVVAGADAWINCNPLTTLAYRALGANPTRAQVNEAMDAVAKAFGLSAEVLASTPPIAVNSAAWAAADKSSPAARYGLALAVFSGMDAINGGDMQQSLDDAAAGLVDGGGGFTSEAMAQLLAGAARAQDSVSGVDLVGAMVSVLAPAATSAAAGLTVDVGTRVADLAVPVVAQLSEGQLAALDAGQVGQFTAAQLAVLTGQRIRALGTDLTGLSAEQVATLSDEQLRALTVSQKHALFAAGDLAGLSAAQLALLTFVAPAFTSGATASFAENGTGVVYTAAATPDVIGKGITYSITGGADAGRFNIDAGTGAVSFRPGMAPNFEAPADAGGDNVYHLIVTATEADNAQTASRTVAITVSDVNEAPQASQTYAGEVVLEVGVGQDLQMFMDYRDPDVQDTLSYEVVSGTLPAGLELSADGQLTGTATAVGVYNLEIRASDSGGLSHSNSYQIRVRDTQGPVFESDGWASMEENSTAVVYTPVVNDNVGVVGFEFVGGDDDALFELDAQTGALRFLNAPDFENPAGVQANNQYTVRIKAVDAAGNEAEHDVWVEVTDVDESVVRAAPAFTSGATASFAENGTGVVYTAVATPDVIGKGISYSITGGADAGRFNIDAGTGAVSFRPGMAPNFEAPADAGGDNVYHLIVTATEADNAQTASRTVAITVSDVNEAPQASQTYAGEVVLEVGVGQDLPMFMDYRDPDADDALSYEVVSGTLPAGLELTVDGQLQGSAQGLGVSTVVVQARDRAGLTYQHGYRIEVRDTQMPVFESDGWASMQENSTAVVYTPVVNDNVGVVGFEFAGGDDDALFELDAQTGALSFATAPDYEVPGGVQANNLYTVRIKAVDAAGNEAEHDVWVEVTDVDDSSAERFDAWSVAASAQAGDASMNLQALNMVGAAIMQQRDLTSRGGRANQADQGLCLLEWVDAVTGTGVVSSAELAQGFSITGRAAAGMEGVIRFWLDNDRTVGQAGDGALMLSAGDNDVNDDGLSDVHVTYDNASGEWALVLVPGSAALLQATHGVWSSGVHQIVVDSNGDGVRNDGEAERLFLVASGTASSAHQGLVSQNFSVHDRLSNQVFVYYFGDPDSSGVGIWTAMDAGDRAERPFLVDLDRDKKDGGDWDYHHASGGVEGRQATVANTALCFVTQVAAQVWEFNMAFSNQQMSTPEAGARDHVFWQSNTSRLPSLEEGLALYAANFGRDTAGSAWLSDPQSQGHEAGEVQPLTSLGSVNDYLQNAPEEDNTPRGWGNWLVTSAALPSGLAVVHLDFGSIRDTAITQHSSFWPVLL